MANTSRPNGFRPYEKVLRASVYEAGGTVYPGDCVKMNSSGQVVVAAAGDRLLGVAAAYQTTGNKVNVWDDPDQKFVAQVATGLTVAQTNIGNNADIVATAGNSTFRQSRQEISATMAATAAQVKILAMLPAEKNEAGDLCKVVCMINEHELDDLTDLGV